MRTAPNVIPRNRCLRKRIVKIITGTRNRVAPAATAGQSLPPTPIMVGMNGGAVCAVPDVSSTANAYSFQAVMKQKGKGNSIRYFVNTTFNYPTMAEAYRIAALNGINRLS